MIGAQEPPAAARQLALSIRQTYVALRQSGFNDDQAMELTCTLIEANIAAGGGEE